MAAGLHSQGDRDGLDLPGMQEDLLQAVHATGTPVVLVLLNGSPISVNWAAAHVPAIVEAWYPGEEGGTALADVLFGDYNPAGRLPVTFPRSLADLPPFEDYRMAGRTYRYADATPLFSFGYGLSYTRFAYTNLHVPAEVKAGEGMTVRVDVSNVGERAGDEVVQLYVRAQDAPVPTPVRHLEGFRRITLQPGETQTVTFTLRPEQLSLITDDGRRMVLPGEYGVWLGGGQPGYDLPGAAARFLLSGAAVELDL